MADGANEPQVKRRKVRKGTRSCWECKGRKAKCTYATPEDTICDGCFRRGTKCISQDLPEQPLGSVDRKRQMGNRMVRVEALIEKLVKNTGTGSLISGVNGGALDNLDAGKLSSANTLVHPPEGITASRNPTFDSSETLVNDDFEHFDNSNYEKISETLLAIYPSQESVDMILRASGPMPTFFHQLVARKLYKEIQITEKQKHDQMTELSIRHTPKTHPLVIVRQMLLLAISFRYIHPSIHHELKGFNGSPGAKIQSIADAAIDLVTKNDKMVNNLEGLECLLLASSFQADSGNLRAAWSITRRAMLTAQLMCLHHHKRPPLTSIQSEHIWDPQLLWYRIVYFDRFFSLILGMPQGSTDISMGIAPPLEDDTPMDRLERRHCVLASRILQRNDNDSISDSLTDIHAIDMELRKLSESMPSKWWLVPNLASIQQDDELFWATIRLTNQLFHYILLSHLHLPFLLQSSPGSEEHRYEYSRMACINASRDLLQRYMAFRTFNRSSYCCHSMDFFAITASMTLVLAHLDGHGSNRHSDSVLLHQRTADRAIMEETLDNMEQVGTLNKTRTVSERGAGVLRRLLAIEAEAARGSTYRVEKGDCRLHDARALRLTIPYFGVITITKGGPASRQEQGFPIPTPIGADMAMGMEPQRTLSGNGLIRPPIGEVSSTSQSGTNYTSTTTMQQNNQSSAPDSRVLNPTFPTLQMADDNDTFAGFKGPSDSLIQTQSFNPDLTVRQEDWVFDDVDISLFDSLLRESDAQGGGNGDYWWLL